MSVNLSPYLNFRDSAREALTFYQRVLGGTLTMSTFAEYQVSEDPAEADKIMHGMLVTDAGLLLMGSDVPNVMEFNRGDDLSVSLSGDDEAALRSYWDGLSEGADIQMPLEQAPWGDWFGGLRDRFGVSWMVNISPVREG